MLSVTSNAPAVRQSTRHLQAELQELRSSSTATAAGLQLRLGETQSRLQAADAGVIEAGARAENSSAALSRTVSSCGLILHMCIGVNGDVADGSGVYNSIRLLPPKQICRCVEVVCEGSTKRSLMAYG